MAAATIATVTWGPYALGRPERAASFSPSRPRAANRPRHLRTVFTLTARSRAMAPLLRPSAAASTIRARSTARTCAFRETAVRIRRSRTLSSNSTTTASTIPDNLLPTGLPIGSPEDCMDRACYLYLGDQPA